MRAPAHVATAALAGALAFPAQPGPVLVTVLAGMLPDIDTPNSLIGRGLFFISVPIRIIFGHRTITHSVLGAVATGMLFATLLADITKGLPASAVLWPWMLGYATHLLLDSITTDGVPLLWPYGQRFGLRLDPTGGVLELAYTLALAIIWLSPWGRGVVGGLL